MASPEDRNLVDGVDHDEVPTQASHPAIREGERRGLPKLRELGPYRLERTLGWGGMGIVYAAIDGRSGETVALKLLRFSDPEGVGLRRFMQEAEATRRVHHPNIVGLREVGRADEYDYYTMDLVEGVDFATWIREISPTIDARVRVLAKVARAVDHAHRRQLLHRDLKPANLIIDARGEPFVTDFGLARAIGAESSLTATDQAVGTPQYMSPEQARGRHQDCGPPSDVFALGVMLYEAVCGRQPFHGETVLDVMQQVVNVDPPLPRQVAPVVPPPLERIIMQCLEKDPRHRYASAEALAEDLERFLQGATVLARRYSTWTRALRWTRLRWKVVATVAVLLAAVGITAWALNREQRFDPGRWVEAWVWDCTRQGSDEVAVTLVHGEHPGVPQAAWPRHAAGEGLHPERAIWCWLDGIRIASDVRVELDVRTHDHLDGIEVALSSQYVEFDVWSQVPRGYSCQWSGYAGSLCFISRNEVSHTASFAYGAASPLEQGRDYTLAFSRVGERLWLEVDGEEILVADYPLPMVGEGMDRIGFRTYSQDLELRAVRVSRLAGNVETDPLALPDAALRLGRFDEAMDGYRAIAEAYEGELAARALGRAYLAALQLDTVEPGRRAELRERLFARHGSSRSTLTALEVEAQRAWMAGDFVQAFELVAACFERDEETQVAYRILETRRDPPPERAQDLLAYLGRTPDLRSLRLNDWGVTDLGPLADLELAWFEAKHNDIADLSPLSGMPLVWLNLEGNPRIDTVEPLRGAPLRWLTVAGSLVDDLSPIAAAPLRSLNVRGTPVADVMALARPSLRHLNISDCKHLTGRLPVELMGLVELSADDSGVTIDLRRLDLAAMSRIDCSRLEVTGIEALARHLPARTLLNGVGIGHLPRLPGSPVEELQLGSCGLTDLSALAEVDVDYLQLDGNGLVDCSPLAGATIDRLHLNRNGVRDLAPLEGTGLRYLEVIDNPLGPSVATCSVPQLILGETHPAPSRPTGSIDEAVLAQVVAAWEGVDDRVALRRSLAALLAWRRDRAGDLRAGAVPLADLDLRVRHLPLFCTRAAAEQLAASLGARLVAESELAPLAEARVLPPGYRAWIADPGAEGRPRSVLADGRVWTMRDSDRESLLLGWED